MIFSARHRVGSSSMDAPMRLIEAWKLSIIQDCDIQNSSGRVKTQLGIWLTRRAQNRLRMA